MVDTGYKNYSVQEALNRIYRSLTGDIVPHDIPNALPGEVYSINEAVSRLAELFENRLYGITGQLPEGWTGGGTSLSEYENIIVVDEAGNGDYTSLSSALASIEDASSSNRYAIILYGKITETSYLYLKSFVSLFGVGNAVINTAYPVSVGNVSNITVSNIRFENTTTNEPPFRVYSGASELRVYNCRFINSNDTGMYCDGGDNVIFHSCYFYGKWNGAYAYTGTYIGCVFTKGSGGNGNAAALVLNQTSSTNKTRVVGCVIYTELDAGIIFASTTQEAYVSGCVIIHNGASGYAGYITQGSVLGRVVGCQFIALQGAHGFYYNGITSTLLKFVGCYFTSATGNAVGSSSSFAAAPFYFCAFDGTVLNIACDAGTANGTSVEI